MRVRRVRPEEASWYLAAGWTFVNVIEFDAAPWAVVMQRELRVRTVR